MRGKGERKRDINRERERERERETVTKESVTLHSAVSQDIDGNKINLFLFCCGLKLLFTSPILFVIEH